MNYQNKSEDVLGNVLHAKSLMYNSSNELTVNNELTDRCIIQSLKISEERNQISKKDYKKAQALASIGNWKWYISSNEVFWSEEMYHIFGIDKNSFTGQLGDIISELIHPDDLHLILPSNAADFAKEKIIEYRIIFPDKSIRYILSIAGESSFDEFGNIEFLSGITQDITDLKQAELFFKPQINDLTKLNAEKDLFLSILAHDLRSPFNSILGFMQLLIENIHTYEIKIIEKQLRFVNNSMQIAYNLCDDLLLWANSQSGKLPFEPQKLNLKEISNMIIHETIQFAGNKSITINQLVKDDIFVFADLNMLKTILRNLISNALKFTNKGGLIEINAGQTDSLITVSISYNGIGLSPEIAKKLFDVFRTHTTLGTDNERGTGFGLFVCKQFVESHNCKLWVEIDTDSEAHMDCRGKGSSFKFTLPGI